MGVVLERMLHACQFDVDDWEEAVKQDGGMDEETVRRDQAMDESGIAQRQVSHSRIDNIIIM